MVSCTPIQFPPGYRFRPTDEELITHYLLKKVKREPLLSYTAVKDCDVYGDGRLWRSYFNRSNELSIYFFSKLRKKSEKSKRIDRVTNFGTWKGQHSDVKIHTVTPDGEEIHIGAIRSFSFYPNDEAREPRCLWTMYEYRLDGSSLTQVTPSEDCYVICKVVRKKKDVKVEENVEDRGELFYYGGETNLGVRNIDNVEVETMEAYQAQLDDSRTVLGSNVDIRGQYYGDGGQLNVIDGYMRGDTTNPNMVVANSTDSGGDMALSNHMSDVRHGVFDNSGGGGVDLCYRVSDVRGGESDNGDGVDLCNRVSDARGGESGHDVVMDKSNMNNGVEGNEVWFDIRDNRSLIEEEWKQYFTFD